MSTDGSDRVAPWRAPLAIGALGASTCFGGMTTAAAAARAGQSRGADVADLTYLDGETGEKTAVAGAAIVGVTDGFEGTGRLGRMSQVAIDELTAAAPWLDPRRTLCFVALPPLPDDAARRAAASVARSLGAPLERARAFASGHSGVAQALRAAGDALLGGSCEHAVVGACDSWLDPQRLQEIAAAGRLKTREDPVGFMPGEAAVFLVLERLSAAANRREVPAAILADVREDAEENHHAAGRPPTGRALARAALAGIGRAAPGGRGTFYVDLNGETYRAADWAMARTRMKGTHDVDAWVQEYPAASFGDTGAAGALLAMGLAARAFARGYAVGDQALVLASGDGPERLALLVERPRAASER